MTADRWLRGACEQCGPVRLAPERVVLATYPAGATVSFDCLCGRHNVDDADPPMVAALRRLGVSERRIALPARRPSSDPPLRHDDLLDFHESLEGTGWIEELFA